jgi:hypothetical protein
VTLKTLTIWNPWAWLCIHPPALGYDPKDVENRDWWSGHRGLLAIHAGKHMDWAEFQAAMDLMADRGIPNPFEGMVPATDFVYGAIIGVVDMTDCARPSAFPYSRWHVLGKYGFVFAKPRPIQPIACRGMPGLWDLPDAIGAAVREQVEGRG